MGPVLLRRETANVLEWAQCCLQGKLEMVLNGPKCFSEKNMRIALNGPSAAHMRNC